MKRPLLTLALIAVIVLGGACLWYQSASSRFDQGPTEPITVAFSPFESTALFWIAADQGFFNRHGLDITLRHFDSGAAALDSVMNGDADLCVGTTEYPLVRQAFANASVRTLAVIDKGDFIYLVGRKDRGIRSVQDLRGKRVGTTIGTISEFHLVRYLNLHNMTLKDITLVDLATPAEWVNATADGDIDAIATAQPYANEARDRLGENAVIWPIQSDQPLFALVVAGDLWIERHPDTARRFLQSLADAEKYLTTHPSAESRAIVQRRLNLKPEYMDTVWQQNRFSLSLDRSLIAAMEDEGRWMIANRLTNATAVPDFRKYIDITGLKQVMPDAVTIL